MCFKINSWNNEQIFILHQEQVVTEYILGMKKKENIYFKNTTALGELVIARYNNCILRHYSCFVQHKYKIRPFLIPYYKVRNTPFRQE